MSSLEAMPRRCSSFCYSSSSPGSKFLPCCCYCWPHGFADGYSSNSGATQGRMPGSPLPPLQMCWTPPPLQLRPQPTGYAPLSISAFSTLSTPKFWPHVLSCAVHVFDKMPKRGNNASQYSRQMKTDVAVGRLAYKQCG